MFEPIYQPLSQEHPEWGQIAILTWDAEIFGFPVAEMKMGDAGAIAADRAAFEQTLVDWAARRRVELVACAISPEDALSRALLQRGGFQFVDSTIQALQSRVQKTRLLPPRVPIRLAEPADAPAVERIAEHAFRSGRYHADPFFPRALSERRYRHWVRNAFATLGPEHPIHVMGEPGSVRGFGQLDIKAGTGYVTIIAVAHELQSSIAGFDLCNGLFNMWKQIGLGKFVGKFSPSNIPMLNTLAHFGFRFAEPQLVFHWHAPNALHLLTADAIWAGSR